MRIRSFGTKLLLMTMLTSAVAVAMACTAIATRHFHGAQAESVKNLSTHAELIALHSVGALLFSDHDTTKEILGSLDRVPSVAAAAIYNTDGRLFAQYHRHPENPTAWADTIQSGRHAEGSMLIIVRSIEHDEEVLGTLLVRYDMQKIYQHMVFDVIAAAAAGGVALLIAFVLSFWLQKMLAKPIAELGQTAQRVSKTQDYATRAQKYGNDELGQLTETFNHMLEQIQARDTQLASYQGELEQRVSDRTYELTQAMVAAQAASRTKSEFLATMSHEIRTPMNGVIGMLSLMQGTALNHIQQQYTQIAKSSADALLNLINNILDFSKIEADKIELEHTPFALRESIENWVLALALKAAEKHIELICDITPSVPSSVRGDPSRLRQVLTNLVGNAIKFTEQGEVVVYADAQPDAPNGLTVRFEIRDTGIGIPPDRVDHVFESFSQVDASTTRKYGGTGLGLAISKGLVEQMGGQIGVHSQPGQGTTFWFTVKLALEDNATCPVHDLDRQVRHLRVLIIDDNATNRNLLQEQLQAWGAWATTASNPHEGFDKLTQATQEGSPFDLALIDMSMPEGSGLDLTAQIKSTPTTQPTAVVLMNSIESQLDQVRLDHLQIRAQLIKPIRQSDLYDALVGVTGPYQPLEVEHQPSAAAGQPRQSQHTQTQARILLAEDNQINQMVAVEVLTQTGYRCDVVENGKQAAQAVLHGGYDLVLMDCQMPEVDGFEATRRIRQAERDTQASPTPRARIPIIALTANATQGDRQKCLDAGMDDYLTKPLDVNRLLQTIEAHLAQAHGPPPVQPPTQPQPETPRAATDVPTGTPLDLDEALKRCMGNAQLLQQLLNKFAERSIQDIEQLIQHVHDGDAEGTVQSAHKIKGAAANLSLRSLQDLAATLEAMGREGDLQHAAPFAQQLRLELDRCLSSIPLALDRLTDQTHGAPDPQPEEQEP